MSARPLRFAAAAMVCCLSVSTRPSAEDAQGAAVPANDGHSIELLHGWKVQSSASVTAPGEQISQPAFATTGWLPISQPETLMAALLENGRYPNIFFSNTLASVDAAQFKVNWWYREDLELHPKDGQHTFLEINGALSRANLWVNGRKLASETQIQGAYARIEIDVTAAIRDGANAIALEVFPNDSSTRNGYLTLDMNDWNPPSPDKWTGLQYAPVLKQEGPVSLRDVHVVQKNADDLSSSDLTVKAVLRNNTATDQTTTFSGTIARAGATVRFSQQIAVPANRSAPVAIGPADEPQLHIARPAIWWPYQLGDQPLYHLETSARVGTTVSDAFAEDVGIRTVTSRLTPVVAGRTLAPSGYRQFIVNGVPLVIRGGGWSQEFFLRYSSQNVHDQLAYIRNMGLNAVRFEGNFPPDDMFEQMDRMGVLAMPGWECCNRWEPPSARWTDDLRRNAANQAKTMAERLRDHASVFVFLHGSDEAPDAAKETIYLDAFKGADWALPQVAAAEYKASPQLGPAGAKEGPYNYAPPGFWWDATEKMNAGGDYTNAGGAFGFQTEASPGNTIPTVDSLARFMTPEDQARVFDTSSTGGKGTGPDIFHTHPYSDYTAVGRLGQYNTPLWNRYGHWTDMASYQREAQAGGYEVTRAEFEAYVGHSKDPANPSTGLIYWMMNKPWPSLQWNLYGSDFDQAGVYFGAQKASEPVHILYAYDDGSIKVVNLTNAAQSGLSARAEFIDLNGAVKDTSQAAVPMLSSQDVQSVLRPAVPAGISTTYFLRLTLTRGAAVVSRNVYWLSTKPDEIDWPRTVSRGKSSGSGAFFQPNGYADLTGLRALAAATIQVSATSRRDGDDEVTSVTIRNASSQPTVGFFLRADVRRGDANGRVIDGDNQVLPILWNDNDVTLWPGESQTLTARYRRAELEGAAPIVSVFGWNAAQQVATAPER
jgi:exo-1,4-beta-D-glucosaminidase